MPVVIAALVVLLGAGAAAPRDVNAVSVAAGDYHSCALTVTSEVKCWGDNTSGELGDGTSIQRSTPVPVAGMRGRVVAISVGGVHSCALEDSGTVECWGWNAAGQLGIGPGPDRLQPVTVRDLGPAAAVAAGGEHTCALTTGGGVKCWGHNNFGGLGDGTTTARRVDGHVRRTSTGRAQRGAVAQSSPPSDMRPRIASMFSSARPEPMTTL